MKALITTGFAAIAAISVGCSSAPSSSSTSGLPVYSSNQVGTVATMDRGEVVSVRQVLIQAQARSSTSTGTGATLGAAAVTSAITGGTGAVANAVGNIAGGTLGAKADDRMGDEITIKLSTGEIKTIVQEQGKDVFYPGQKVMLQTGSAGRGSSRVISADDLNAGSDVVGRKL